MGFKEDSTQLAELVSQIPELDQQFDHYAEAGYVGILLLGRMIDHSAGIIAVQSAMILGATLYRDWLIGKGINIKEVEGKILDHLTG